MFFPVCIWKFSLMTLCTAGIYQVYWFYKNWYFVKSRDNRNLSPALRSILAVFFCYSLLRDVYRSTSAERASSKLEPVLLAVVFVILFFIAGLPDPFWIAGFLNFIPLLLVQARINRANLRIDEMADLNCKLSGWNILAVIAGCLLLPIAIWGTFLSV